MAFEVGVNSYISVADADAYFADRLGSGAWSGPDKQKVLMAATRAVERLTFVGTRKEALQSLQFPRCYTVPSSPRTPSLATDGLSGYFSGTPTREECETEVPKAVKDAVCEEALAILESAGDAQAELRGKLQRQGVTSIKIGSTSESYGHTPRSVSALLTDLTSGEAEALLFPYLSGPGGFG